MAPPLKPCKTRLTKAGNTLEELINDTQHLLTYTVPVLENEEETKDLLSTKKKIIQQRQANITSAKLSVDAAVSNFQETFSKMDSRAQQEEQASQETYLDHDWDLISTAEAVLCKLAEKEIEVSSTLENLEQAAWRRQRRLQNEVAPQSSNESPRQMSPFSYASSQIQALLPRLQLPKFGGRRHEWDTFWAIFKANVDEQPIPTMIKFNYLLQALVGEARQTAAQFQIIESNYQAVMDTLLKKYGRDSSIIEDLLAQLETCKADGPSTKQQAILLEKLTAILMQLTTKGQDVNQRIILDMVMRKFNTDIQTKVLERRERLRDVSEWTWSVLQKDLSDMIDTKEQIERSQEIIKKPSTLQPAIKERSQGKRPVPACIYCKRTNHRSLECRTVPITERAAFLARNQLCLNCGKPNHRAEDCRSQGCFKCGRKHHSSLCRSNLPPTTTRPFNDQERPRIQQISQQNRPIINQGSGNNQQIRGRGPLQARPRQANQNVVTLE